MAEIKIKGTVSNILIDDEQKIMFLIKEVEDSNEMFCILDKRNNIKINVLELGQVYNFTFNLKGKKFISKKNKKFTDNILYLTKIRMSKENKTCLIAD